ncbi:MAG: hypothetical protein ACOCXH_02430 [Cyclobacteriaceae bacterium]
MQYANKISTSITRKEVDEIVSHVDQINKKLENLVKLTEEEKSAMPHMGEETIAFVFNVLEKAEKEPSLVPAKVDLDEIKKDVELISAINKIYHPLKDLVRKLEDSALIASSEAYFPALAIFNSIKNAHRKAHIDSRANFSNYPKAGEKKNLLSKQKVA